MKNTDDKEIINKIITKEGFNDQEILSRIAVDEDNTYDKYIRSESLDKIDDDELFKEIAFNEENELVRLKAISRLDDEDALKKNATESSDSSSRLEAEKKIENEAILSEIAKSDDD